VSVDRVERQAILRYAEGVLGYGQTFTPADIAKFGKAPYTAVTPVYRHTVCNCERASIDVYDDNHPLYVTLVLRVCS